MRFYYGRLQFVTVVADIMPNTYWNDYIISICLY